MKTTIQELIDKYDNHLKNDDDLDTMSGKDILKIVLVDLISYQVKEKQQIFDAYWQGTKDWSIDDFSTSTLNKVSEKYYNETFKKD